MIMASVMDSPNSAQRAEVDAPLGIVTTIILPALNEAEALPQVLEELTRVLDAHYEILVVDDGSTDNTPQVVLAQHCRLVQHPARRGKGAAVRTGVANARGQFIIIMDADATYPASAIPQITNLLADNDLVRCNRETGVEEHMPFINKVGNWLFDTLLSNVHGLDGNDHLSGMYGLRREAALRLKLQSNGFDIEAEIGIKARAQNLRITSFPIQYQSRVGEKKLRPWRDGFAILSRIVALVLLYNPLAIFVAPGLVLMGLFLGATVMLQTGPIITPYFGLSIHSFIVVTLGVLAAFQLSVFGMAAALYGVEAGYQPPGWLVFLSSRYIRLSAAVIGLVMAFGATIDLIAIMLRWFAEGAGLFVETQAVVLGATVLVWGLQIVSAALFLSIFYGRLQKFAPVVHPEPH